MAPLCQDLVALISTCAYGDSRCMDEIRDSAGRRPEDARHPRRLEIRHALAYGPIEVGRLAQRIGASQPNVSQHLAVLRTAGLALSVTAARSGTGWPIPTSWSPVGSCARCWSELTRLWSDGRAVGDRSGAGSHGVM